MNSHALETTVFEINLKYNLRDLDCVHTMPAHFENGEKCDSMRILASVHTMPEQFGNGTKFDRKKLTASL